MHWPQTDSMRRGEVWWVSFAGSSGGEVRKTRPAVIVSNDVANLHANRVQVVPVSSKTEKCFPCDAKVLVAGQESKAMADQLTTIAKEKRKKGPPMIQISYNANPAFCHD